MQSVRIEPQENSRILLVDIVCGCGKNGLRNEATGNRSFKHPIALGVAANTVLSCECGKKYGVRPQGNHIHVFDA